MRVRWLKAELKLVLQARAVCRAWVGGDIEEAGKLYKRVAEGDTSDPTICIALMPFLAAMEPFRAEGAAYDKRLAKLARSLPVWDWVKSVWGFSDLGLAKIVGEAGDVGSYRNPSCLWKRLGLAPYQGKAVTKGRGGLTAEEWAALGYSPRRRSAMWNIGNGLIGGMGNGVRPAAGEDWQAREDWSYYQKVYVGRLIYMAERDPENFAREPTKLGKMSFSKWAHNDAKRFAEKRVLLHLWQRWRAADRGHLEAVLQPSRAPVSQPSPSPVSNVVPPARI